MSGIIIGTEDCSITKILRILKSSNSFSLFYEKWPSIAYDLNIPSEDIRRLRKNLLLDTISLGEAVCEVLEIWKRKDGEAATLDKLLSTLEVNGLKHCSELLEKAFEVSDKKRFKTFTQVPPEIVSFLKSDTKTGIITSVDVRLTCLKLKENVKNCKILSFQEFLELVSSHQAKTLTVDSVIAVTVAGIDQLLQTLSCEIASKLIVVIKQDSDLSKIEFKDKGELLTDHMSWKDLSPKLKFELKTKLENTTATQLEEATLESSINGELLANLLNGKEPNLFQKAASPLTPCYYVDRFLISRNILDNDKLFTDKSPDIYLIQGITRSELTHFVQNKVTGSSSGQIQWEIVDTKFIILDSPTHFEKICGKTKNSVHWVTHKEGKFSVTRSFGELNGLQRLVSSSQETFNENEFIQFLDPSSQPVCISDSPGMGKSILLARLGNILRKDSKNSCKIISLLQISSFINQLKKLAKKGPMTEAVNSALVQLICKNPLEKAVFEDKLNKDNLQIELLLDGLDELPSGDLNLAWEALNIIKKLPSVRLWVTTRPHLLQKLENDLNVLGFNIQPFSEADQKQFLCSFWSSRLTKDGQQVSEQKLAKFAEGCLELVKAKTSKTEQSIAGIPLQCLLIGEVYEDKAQDYCLAFDTNVSERLIQINSMAELYQKLVEKKITKYEKIFEESKPNKSEILLIHVKLALQLIFPEYLTTLAYQNNYRGSSMHLVRKLYKVFPIKSQLIQQEINLNDVLNIGILEKSATLVEPRFIHRTFAEYFVAWYAANYFNQQVPLLAQPSEISLLLDKILSTTEIDLLLDMEKMIKSYLFKNSIICYFFNNLLTPSKLPQLKFKKYSKIIPFASAHVSFLNIFNLFDKLRCFEENPAKIFTDDYVIFTIEYSTWEFVEIALSNFEKFHNFHAYNMKIKALNLSITKCKYSTLEYLLNVKGLSAVLKKVKPNAEKNGLHLLLHYCVHNTEGKSEEKLEQIVQIMQLLVRTNPYLLEEMDPFGNTPLLMKSVHVKLIIELIRLGADITAQDKENNVVLHVTKSREHFTADDYQALITAIPDEMMKILVQVKNLQGLTPLASAVEKGLKLEVKTLTRFYQTGANFNCEVEGEAILAVAIKFGWTTEHLEKLIEYGADVTWSKIEMSLIHYAAKYRNAEAVTLLVKHGLAAKLNLKDNQGKTPLDLVLTGSDKVEDWTALKDTAKELQKQGGTLTDPTHIFLEAAKTGNAEVMELLLETGMATEINFISDSSDGNTVFHLVAKQSRAISLPKLVTILLEYHADPNILNSEGKSVFQVALRNPHLDQKTFRILKSLNTSQLQEKDVSLMKKFLTRMEDFDDEVFSVTLRNKFGNHGGDLNWKNEDGNSLLHLSIQERNLPCVNYLISKGVNLDAVNKNKQTPLLLLSSSYNPKEEIDKKLLKKLTFAGADLYLKNNENATFLHELCKPTRMISPLDFHEVVEFLLKKNQARLFNTPGCVFQVTPFVFIAWNLEIEEKTLKLLQNAGVDLNAVDKEGRNVFFYAIGGKRSTAFLTRLMESSADINQLNPYNNQNLVHVAVKYGNSEALEFILKTGMNVNLQDEDGNAPIHLILEFREEIQSVLKKMTLLLQYKADFNLKNKQNGTFLHLLLSSKEYLSPGDFHKLTAFLIESGHAQIFNVSGGESQGTPLHSAMLNIEPEPETLELLLSSPEVDFKAVDKHNIPTLIYAVHGKRSLSVLKKIIDLGDVEEWKLSNYGSSVLHTAAESGTVEALNYFLERVKDPFEVNRQATSGNTPLHCAMKEMDKDVVLEKVKLLVEKGGADIKIKTKMGQTPLAILLEEWESYAITDELREILEFAD